MAKRVESINGQFHEQASPILPLRILAEDDLASFTIHLANFAGSVTLMPKLLESERGRCRTEALGLRQQQIGQGVCTTGAEFVKLRPSRIRPISIPANTSGGKAIPTNSFQDRRIPTFLRSLSRSCSKATSHSETAQEFGLNRPYAILRKP